MTHREYQYNFVDTWNVAANRQLVANVIADVEKWPQWWPALKSVSVTKKVRATVGSQATMTWKAPLGYRLHLQLTITEYVAGKHIAFISAGDLEGFGSWNFAPENDITRMTITWKVATKKRWMNVLAPLLRPLFMYAHHVVMSQGERGLQRWIA